MTTTSRPPFAFALALFWLTTGCDNTGSRLSALEEEVAPAGQPTVAQQLAAESAARQQGLTDTLAACKAYTDGALGGSTIGAQLAAEVARAKAAEADAVTQAKAYTDQAIAGAMPKAGLQAHLIAPGGVDLGVYLGGAVAWNAKLGAPVDYRRQGQVVYSGPNCTGQALIVIQKAATPIANTRFIGPDGTIFTISGSSQSGFNSQSDVEWYNGASTGCEKNVNVFSGYSATATKDTATPYEPESLSVVMN